MTDRLIEYKQGDTPLPERNRLWPLYGAGFENLGLRGDMIERPLPSYGPDELLVRHDATGICFSDIKVIRTGQDHPRIYRNMSQDPVVLGHEVSLTVVGVGENLKEQYKVGDRFIIQADVYINGVGYAYGYEIQGGFSQYNVIDQRVLNGDGGNYLLALRPTTGYAESALSEPWACVEASYHVGYRSTWKPGGTVWIVGDGRGVDLGAAAGWQPGQVVLDVQDAAFGERVAAWAEQASVNLVADAEGMQYDDIVVLGADPELMERTFPRLAKGGTFVVVTDQEIPRTVRLDIGRLHYDNLAIMGATSHDLSAAYAPIRTQLRPGGVAWILGAGGPMGQMHLQRALEIDNHPAKVVANDLSTPRMKAVEAKFAGLAQETGVELVCISQESYPNADDFKARMLAESGGRGFDDIAVLAPSVPAIEKAMPYLADNAMMNVFAGLPRGTMAMFDMNAIVQRNVRYTGTSGSSIEDLAAIRDMTENQTLSPNKSVSAIAGLEGVSDGMHAVAEGRFPGKIVIFPNLSKPLPLTALSDLKETLPTVYAKLAEGEVWTKEAEDELLRLLI